MGEKGRELYGLGRSPCSSLVTVFGDVVAIVDWVTVVDDVATMVDVVAKVGVWV